MRRPNESVIQTTPNPLEIKDPDELQQIDEWNSQWVKAWKTAVLEFAKPKTLCKKSTQLSGLLSLVVHQAKYVKGKLNAPATPTNTKTDLMIAQ